MRSTASGDERRNWWRRSWWLGAVLAACLAWAAPAQAQPFVYVAGQSANSVAQFDAFSGALSPLTPATVPDSGGPFQVAVSPDGRNVYFTNNGGGPEANTVSQYSVGAGGALTPMTPATVPAGQDPTGIAVTPDDQSVYVTSFGDGTVSLYDVGPAGALTPKGTVAAPDGGATRVAVSPDGKSVYVTNISSTVSQYDVGPGGALTPKTPATVATAPEPLSPGKVGFAPDGKSAYVPNGVSYFAGSVSQYDVGPTGTLAPKTPASVPAGFGTGDIAVTPDGKNLYVTDASDDTVSQYTVGPNGTLTAKTPATVPAGDGPEDIAVSPDGSSIYVTDFAAVFQFNVGASGALTAKTPATVPVAPGPAGIAVTPVPATHSTSATVVCSPTTSAPGDVTVCTATVTDTAVSGRTTPTGTVTFTSSGTGGFLGSPCTLSGSGVSASCGVFFTSFARGGQGITATYSGDSSHSASAGSTLVLVALPASTSGCVVFGHGRITAANRDRASFRELVAATPPRGAQFYRDNGPADAFRLASSRVDALTCSADASMASVFGSATLNGGGSVQYRIDVQLTAWRGGKDTYRIRLSNGYDSGVQQLRHGDVAILVPGSQHHHQDTNANRYKPGVGPDGG